jgi:quercetin dioxygenase-like cupin family protein
VHARSIRLIASIATAASLALVIAAFTAGLGSATPPAKSSSVVLAQGQTTEDARILNSSGTDVVVAKNRFAAGGSSGWHSHPGIAVITVKTGQITLAVEPISGGQCRVHTYHAGDTFLEHPANEQNGVNRGDAKTVVLVTFFRVPHGGSARIDQPAPGNCP